MRTRLMTIVPLLAGAALLGGCSGSDGQTNGTTSGPTGDGKVTEEQHAMGDQTDTPNASEATAPYALGLTMNRIDGTPEPLEEYKGKVVLVVNVASRCGLTPQYEALERLYREKKDAGLVVLGFPANNFGGQEPGTNEEIVAFCTGRYDVTFPMFEKISVRGDDQHALYRTLSTVGGEPSWNFTKYLVDRDGRVVERFDPRTTPDDPALVAEVDRLLAQG